LATLEDAKREKENKTKQALAAQIIAKINPTMVSFAQVLSSDNFGNLPSSVMDTATALYSELEKHDKNSRSVLADPKEPLHGGISSIKELTKLINDVKRSSTLICQIFASMERMPSS